MATFESAHKKTHSRDTESGRQVTQTTLTQMQSSIPPDILALEASSKEQEQQEDSY